MAIAACGITLMTKLVCGLLDMHLYARHPDAIPLLQKTTDFARKSFEHENMIVVPSHNTQYYGLQQEWYTLSENLFRAFRTTNDERFKEFAEIWLYHQYWNKFADTSKPVDAQGVHAYSHVNTFSGAAMAYAVLGDPKYLRIIRNAYDFRSSATSHLLNEISPARPQRQRRANTVIKQPLDPVAVLETRFDWAFRARWKPQ